MTLFHAFGGKGKSFSVSQSFFAFSHIIVALKGNNKKCNIIIITMKLFIVFVSSVLLQLLSAENVKRKGKRN